MRRFLASILVLIGLALPCEAAVALDTCGSPNEVSSGNPVTSATFSNLTISAGLTNSAMIAVVAVSGAGTTTMQSAIWDLVGANQAMTLLGEAHTATAGTQVFLFGLRNPTSGNKSVSFAWTTGTQVIMQACSFSGVVQTSDAAAFPHFTSANSAAPSQITITSATGDMVVGVWSNASNFTSVTGGSGSIFSVTGPGYNNGGSTNAVASVYGTGASSVMLTGNPGNSTAANGIVAGVDIAAFGGGGGSTPTPELTMMGVGP